MPLFKKQCQDTYKFHDFQPIQVNLRCIGSAAAYDTDSKEYLGLVKSYSGIIDKKCTRCGATTIAPGKIIHQLERE